MEKKKVFIAIDTKQELPDKSEIYWVLYNREKVIASFTRFKEWYLEKHVFSKDFYYITPEFWLKKQELYCFSEQELKAYIKLKISSYMKKLF